MDRHTLIKKMINAQKALDRGQYQIAWNELYIPDSEIRRYCQWKRDEHHDFYETDCGQAYSLIDGSLKDNHIKFCHFCGKEILADTGKEPGERKRGGIYMDTITAWNNRETGVGTTNRRK